VNASFTQDPGNVKLTSKSSMIVEYLSLTYFKDFQEIESLWNAQIKLESEILRPEISDFLPLF